MPKICSDGQFGNGFVHDYRPSCQQLIEEVQQHSTKLDEEDLSFIDIPFLLATEENLRYFGQIVTNWDKHPVHILQWPSPGARPVLGGTGAGIVGGDFTAKWDNKQCKVRNEGVDGYYMIGTAKDEHIYFQDANTHPDGQQVFYPKEKKPFILVLSNYADESTITPFDFVAFYFDGSVGFAVYPNVYHQAVFPVEDSVTLLDKQGKVHGRVNVDFYKEFGVFMRIRNYKTIPETTTITNSPHYYQPKRNPHQIKPKHKLSNKTGLVQKLELQPARDSNISGFGRLIANDSLETVQISIEKWPSSNRPVSCGDEAVDMRGQPDHHEYTLRLHGRKYTQNYVGSGDVTEFARHSGRAKHCAQLCAVHSACAAFSVNGDEPAKCTFHAAVFGREPKSELAKGWESYADSWIE